MEITSTSPSKNRALENEWPGGRGRTWAVEIACYAFVASLLINKSAAAQNHQKETRFWLHTPMSF